MLNTSRSWWFSHILCDVEVQSEFFLSLTKLLYLIMFALLMLYNLTRAPAFSFLFPLSIIMSPLARPAALDYLKGFPFHNHGYLFCVAS